MTAPDAVEALAAAQKRLRVMKPEDDWGDKFYAALEALTLAVGQPFVARGESPHQVMAEMIDRAAAGYRIVGEEVHSSGSGESWETGGGPPLGYDAEAEQTSAPRHRPRTGDDERPGTPRRRLPFGVVPAEIRGTAPDPEQRAEAADREAAGESGAPVPRDPGLMSNTSAPPPALDVERWAIAMHDTDVWGTDHRKWADCNDEHRGRYRALAERYAAYEREGQG